MSHDKRLTPSLPQLPEGPSLEDLLLDNYQFRSFMFSFTEYKHYIKESLKELADWINEKYSLVLGGHMSQDSVIGLLLRFFEAHTDFELDKEEADTE